MKKGWKPKRKGDKYCAPLCGYGCKHAAYLDATKNARALAKRMGKGWKARVWENLDWHWEVRRGGAQLSTDNDGKEYWCLFNGLGFGEVYYAPTPEKAFEKARKDCDKTMKMYQRTLAETFGK